MDRATQAPDSFDPETLSLLGGLTVWEEEERTWGSEEEGEILERTEDEGGEIWETVPEEGGENKIFSLETVFSGPVVGTLGELRSEWGSERKRKLI